MFGWARYTNTSWERTGLKNILLGACWEPPHLQVLSLAVDSLTGNERAKEGFCSVTCSMRQSLYRSLGGAKDLLMATCVWPWWCQEHSTQSGTLSKTPCQVSSLGKEKSIHKTHLFFFLFLFIWPLCSAGRILVRQSGIKLVPPAVEARSLNHQTAREIPRFTS